MFAGFLLSNTVNAYNFSNGMGWGGHEVRLKEQGGN
jgi:hypothetical protein